MKTNRLLDALNLCILALFSLSWGGQALYDLDLGWHLAGGEWMLQHRTVPWRDFLSSDGREWIAYSWLPEVGFAWVQQEFGFRGLQVLQILLIFVAALSVYRVALTAAGKDRLSAMLATLLALPLCAPVWYLRPQLISFIFFAFLLERFLRSAKAPWWMLPLTILWANVHVYWVFTPALFFGLYMLRSLDPNREFSVSELSRHVGVTFALLLCGFCSPYGESNLLTIFEYLFRHSEAYLLINEFHPLVPEFGWLFYYVGAIAAVSLWFAFGALQGPRREFFLLFVLAFLGAAAQRKYLPFFGLLSALIYADAVFPRIFARWKPGEEMPEGSRLAKSLAPICLLALLAYGGTMKLEPPLPPSVSELPQVLQLLSNKSEERIELLNYFDDGGWIEYWLWKQRPVGASESNIKASIDGRTLVMGRTRLAEFRKLITGTSHVCEQAKAWGASFGVLPLDSPIANEAKLGRMPCLELEQAFKFWGLYRVR